jgi:hypothetical protein
VFLQEHWLLPFELDLFSSIHSDFFGFGTSAVDTSVTLLIGRPYGGTGVLYRKHLASNITVLATDECRLTSFIFTSAVGPVLFVNVYMPTDYGDSDSHDDYSDICAKIGSLYVDSDAALLAVLGDFNCSSGSRFFDSFLHLMQDNHLICADLSRLNDVYTYCSDNGLNISWIDHILWSRPVDSLVSSLLVLQDYVSSDHKPLSVCLNNFLYVQDPQDCNPICAYSNDSSMQYDWAKADQYHIDLFHTNVDLYLSNVVVPKCLVCCSACSCTDPGHHCAIDQYYDAVFSAINLAANNSIPSVRYNRCDLSVPGWNEFVKDKHELSRQAFLDWVAVGKPHVGLEVTLMRKTRASFKLALRYCRQHEDQLRADSCANSLESKDPRKFWDNVYKVSNSKANKYATTVGGVSGDRDISNMWKQHFEQLYNSIDCINDESIFKHRLSNLGIESALSIINTSDIAIAVHQQKKGKAVGPDGIAMEAFMTGSSKLLVHLAILFTMFTKHQYVPGKFMQSIIIPLVKCKGGDLTDVNNYRAITLSNSVTKLFESVILNKFQSSSDVDAYQFGFKKGHSTAQSTSLLKRTVDYYRQKGSHVFACFVDFKKAFDRVNYWKLFRKLLDDGINANIVALLAFWYSHQEVSVRWRNVISDSFSIKNGTRQGGILSPVLFTRYIRELLQAIVDTRIGCNIAGVMVNVLAYADDIVLLAPSWVALQFLIDILDFNINQIDIVCNISKTVCMVFKPICRHKVVCDKFPAFMLSGQCLQFIDEFKYLGHILNNNCTDDNDIKREIRNLYARTNVLKKRFSKCSIDVKLMLFKSFCLCLYDSALWTTFNSGSLDRLKACYNKCIKIFFGYLRTHSVTNMLSDLGLPTFVELLDKCRLSFCFQWQTSINPIVQFMVNVFGN